MFPTDYNSVLKRIDAVDPVRYARTRNYVDGDVTRLSPYISRGVISTKQVLETTLDRGFDPAKISKFIQELAWRDYWQHVWGVKDGLINEDLRKRQTGIRNREVPKAIIKASTGIDAVDQSIEELYETGYMHNHVRMYTASIACNVGRCHWLKPAKWMYYHLLDGDWASNALSWQWVAGTNSHKKYFADQANINRFCYTDQDGTFLDVDYTDLERMDVPEALKETQGLTLRTPLPDSDGLVIDESKPTLIYTLYNLDPVWQRDRKANRVLLFEPSHFEDYPVSEKTIEFAIALGENIEGLQIFTGEFEDLRREAGSSGLIYKEHPFSRHFEGTEEPRDWMFDVRGYFPSFSRFWKQCEKELNRQPALF